MFVVFRFNLKNIQTKEELDKYCQIAIVTASLAAIEHIREERPSILPSCVATAGFSLGEITALIFSGALSLEEGKLKEIEPLHIIVISLMMFFLFKV